MMYSEFKKLRIGDLIRHKEALTALVIIGGSADRGFEAVRLVNVSNHLKWDIVAPNGEVISRDEGK